MGVQYYISCLKKKESIFYENPAFKNQENFLKKLNITKQDIINANLRLDRFRPYLKKRFQDTKDGLIESQIKEVPGFKTELEDRYGIEIKGRVFVKMDNTLPIAGSIKARGGIYEVLKLAETILIEQGYLSYQDDYSKLLHKKCKDILSKYTVVVGSTGNLGLSVGIMSAALGFNAEVHMSCDAKEWKKELLKKWGAKVIEHPGDYSYAVKMGRKRCEGDRFAHFVDDENSLDLFLGYATSALRLKEQLAKVDVYPSTNNPICVYLPCGVGGAPGGISFGMAHVFGTAARCYTAEPVGAPCVIGALITGKDDFNIKELGIELNTEADGLAVPGPSKLAIPIIKNIIAGGFTLFDEEMLWSVRSLYLKENIKIEPSAGAGVKGVYFVEKYVGKCDHLIWLTGGMLIPDNEFQRMLSIN